MSIRQKLQKELEEIVEKVSGEKLPVALEHPENSSHGDYATNVSFRLAKLLKVSPVQAGEKLKEELLKRSLPEITDVAVVSPGFLNITLTQEFFINGLSRLLSTDEIEESSKLAGKRILVEYAHPNTHKEMHIGHMRTLITGESLARLLQAAGAVVFRANYQGDIGPHVAKALFGIRKIMEDEEVTTTEVESWSSSEKAHFLGRGYAMGSQMYEENKDLIDNINIQLYANDPQIMPLYIQTRQWSLDYYDEFYSRFHTHFDRLFFESEMVEDGVRIVKEHIGKIFSEENGAVILKGEEYGLHTRVFLTQKGTPTYEAKDLANAYHQYEAFPFDLNIHVVANEQAGYFKVVIKALELIDPEKFKDKEHHLSMGMVNLIGPTSHEASKGQVRKMSSRTGDVLTVDWLLDQVQENVDELVTSGRVESDKKAELSEQIIIGAVKHSVLKVGVGQDVAFDVKSSVSLEGDSGPYLQYTYARTKSVLRKSETQNPKSETGWTLDIGHWTLKDEELQLLRLLSRFNEVVIDAAERYAPNMVTSYLYELAAAFNNFYQKCPILKTEGDLKVFRLSLTEAVGKTISKGLDLLGIQAPERM